MDSVRFIFHRGGLSPSKIQISRKSNNADLLKILLETSHGDAKT